MTKSLEHQFSMLVREIRKENVGNGPREILTRFCGPWVICEMKGNLTNVEKFMISSEDGRRMVHDARTKLVKNIYNDPMVVAKLEEIINAKILRIFSDISLEEDIAMTVYVLDRPIS
ncbi:DUF2294 domain-containing protein [Brevibacillus nitrificans]|uniref:DUF2294 domain-containing protein n=1 Tax=Brevibacillus nitrificans TaxID=651560 RepID=A0A3M8DK68_9BACL|nr:MULTISPECIES: DUF2294 domain-containing protein [Brevibacillus]MED1949542.1 DUF2294 domain-containing protein [Brevibacillus centrosporus]RNB88446.1 DUF2294 domain-containing protein [Brevibacillus nitrificans]